MSLMVSQAMSSSNILSLPRTHLPPPPTLLKLLHVDTRDRKNTCVQWSDRFRLAPSRIFSFKAALLNTPLPLQLVLTRWSTWLHAALYHADYLEDIQKVLYNTLSLALEARDLPLVKAVKIMRGIEENLNQASGSVGTAIVDKFNRVLQRNPGWKVMANETMFPGKRLDTSGEGPTVGILKNEDVKFLMLANSKQMASYKEEEDPFEEIVFDQARLLNTTPKLNTAIRRVSSGKCVLFAKTLGICGVFFGLGLCIAIPGPTFLLPISELQLDVSLMTNIYVARSSGYAVGSIIGGILFDRFNRCNVLCLDLWGRNSAPFMQGLHFSFGLGINNTDITLEEGNFIDNLTTLSILNDSITNFQLTSGFVSEGVHQSFSSLVTISTTQKIPKRHKPSKTDSSKLGSKNWENVKVGVLPPEDLVVVSSTSSSVSSKSELACPALIRHLMVNDPKVLMHAALFLNTLCIVIFATLWWLSSQLGEKYCAITSDGYQLANQHDEEEDMMDINLTTSSLFSCGSVKVSRGRNTQAIHGSMLSRVNLGRSALVD
uniref:Uncharacterized protein n=1 Tax=Timema cristinae TaxID=61476 RepID=A0A7R9GQB5_TIMCR|nr:unnamed protein product [Timema cristinae]